MTLAVRLYSPAEYVFVMVALILLVGGVPIARLCRSPRAAKSLGDQLPSRVLDRL